MGWSFCWFLSWSGDQSVRWSDNMSTNADLGHCTFQTCHWPSFAKNGRTVNILAICERTP